MLALIMLVLYPLRSRLRTVVNLPCQNSHLCHFLHYHRVIYRVRRILPPGKGSMALAYNPWHLPGIKVPAAKGLYNYDPRIFFIIPFLSIYEKNRR